MKIRFTASCMGYGVGGYERWFELDLDDSLTDEEIDEEVASYIEESINFGWEREGE